MRKILVAAAATVVAAGTFSLSDISASADDCSVRTGVDTVRCHLLGTVVSIGELKAQIPAPGDGIEASALYASGPSTLSLDVSTKGVLTITRPGEKRESADTVLVDPGGATTDTGCSRTGYATYPNKEKLPNHVLNWYIKSGTVPSYIGASNFVDVVTTAGNRWEAGTSPCAGYGADQVTLSVTYKGATTHAFDVKSNEGCDIFVDNQNTIGFMNVDNGSKSMALTCTKKKSGSIIDADIAVNSDFKFFYGTQPCLSRYDLGGIMTHEIGHAIGLADMQASADRYLTMGGSYMPCSTYKRSLGVGDVRGVRALY